MVLNFLATSSLQHNDLLASTQIGIQECIQCVAVLVNIQLLVAGKIIRTMSDEGSFCKCYLRKIRVIFGINSYIRVHPSYTKGEKDTETEDLLLFSA